MLTTGASAAGSSYRCGKFKSLFRNGSELFDSSALAQREYDVLDSFSFNSSVISLHVLSSGAQPVKTPRCVVSATMKEYKSN